MSQIKYFLLFSLFCVIFISCDDEDSNVIVPDSYSFERNGTSTVSFSGQTARILMAEELISEMKNPTQSKETLLSMFRNEGPNGEDVAPFSNSDLNSETKSIISKVAASRDYFSSNTAESSLIKNDFENWIKLQVDEVFPAWNELAEPGVPGQIADGSSTRYVSAMGLEYNQLVNKSLIGALMLDQMLNNYLSVSVLDEGDNLNNNDEGIVSEGKAYTNMEHKWDEAYGYLFGTASDKVNPVSTLGADDSFLNKYLGRVDGDEDFAGISNTVFESFKSGRASIVAGDYDMRDMEAELLREKLSEVIGVRAVYYLHQAALAFPVSSSGYGAVFHDLSEAYGFIYSLRFTRKPGSDSAYFTASESDQMLEDLLSDGPNGLWDLKLETLERLSETIASEFDFSVEEAGN